MQHEQFARFYLLSRMIASELNFWTQNPSIIVKFEFYEDGQETETRINHLKYRSTGQIYYCCVLILFKEKRKIPIKTQNDKINDPTSSGF
jgi:hypothetical protein